MALSILSDVYETFVPKGVLENYIALSTKIPNRNWEKLEEEEIWHELCFCILSANVMYDTAKSTLNHLINKRLLDAKWLTSDKKSNIILAKELSKPNYLPIKKNGEFRKYRYPQKRSLQIVKASKIIYTSDGTIKKILREARTDLEARQFFVENIPGLGIKEASHFLRNIGYSSSLAIIDVHILSFLEKTSLVRFDKKRTLTRKAYLLLEKLMRNFAKFHKLTLSILDLAIWHYMRNSIA